VRRTVTPKILTAKSYAEGLEYLAVRDADLARIHAELGTPPEWFREPGFSTLIYIILEQQVSLAAARAVFTRLLALTSPLTPQSFLILDDAQLRAIGFSRQKITYGRNLARSITEGQLKLETFGEMNDAEVKAELVRVKGIGSWTADIYLLMALRRPDAWPVGDLGVVIAVQEIKRLSARPSLLELAAFSELWRPWRAVATRLLWHYYLNRRAKKVTISHL
jgi:DNA-3-methyladenine glycosylase II